MLSHFKRPMCVLLPFFVFAGGHQNKKGHVLIIRLIFSKNIDESDKFCRNFFAKNLINFVSSNVLQFNLCSSPEKKHTLIVMKFGVTGEVPHPVSNFRP